MKKILSIILSLVMLVSIIGAIPVSAKIEFCSSDTFCESFINSDGVQRERYYRVINGVYYEGVTESDGEIYSVKVVAILPPKDTKVVEIPNQIEIAGEVADVDAIDLEEVNGNFEEIIIGDNIYVIRGLCNLKNLKKITIGGFVSISNCFGGCTNLESIEGDSQFVLEEGEVYSCAWGRKVLVAVLDSNVTSYEIKSGTTSVNSPFDNGYKNISVKKLIVNENLDDFITGRIKRLNTITFGENVNKIKNINLHGVRNLKTLDLSNIEVTSFNAKGVWHMKSVTFGKIKKLVKHSFRGCKSIEKIEFKEEIPKIYKDAFKNKKQGIEFYVKNKTAAKTLKTRLKGKGIKNAKIYAKGKLVYENVK